MSPDLHSALLETIARMARLGRSPDLGPDLGPDHGPDHGPITPQTRFNEDLGFDSLNLVELVLRVEQDLNIVLSDDAMATVHHVAGLLAAVAEAQRESA
jgi:acyl carrier protein